MIESDTTEDLTKNSMAKNGSGIPLLETVRAPLELPVEHNSTKIDKFSSYSRVYIQSRTSFARIVFKDGSTYCYNGGYYSDQLWQLDPVGEGFFTIRNISGNNAALFYNGKTVNCFDGQQYDDQLWRFEYDGSGYYRIINKEHAGSKLYLRTSGTFGAYDGLNYDDHLWRILPEGCPLVTLYGLVVGARLVGNQPPVIYRGIIYKDQVWRLIPVDIDEETTPRYVYIQNYHTGLKLAHKASDHEFIAYGGNNYSDQQWEVRRRGGYFQFVNRQTKGKIFANKDGTVSCYVGQDYDDQNWMLLSPYVKPVQIRSSATGAYLSFGASNAWVILPDLNGGYYLQDTDLGQRVFYNGNVLNVYGGQIFTDQIWIITSPADFSDGLYEIKSKQYGGYMYSPNSSSIEVKYDPIPDSEKEKTQFYIKWAEEGKTYNEDLIDEVSDNNMFWLKDESPESETLGDVSLSDKTSSDDDEHYGFKGLDDQCDSVYRVCRPNEDISKGIHCSDPNSLRTVAQHVASGSRIPSRFISTTSDRTVALLWAFYGMDLQSRPLRPTPLRVIQICLDRVRGTEQEVGCVNTNNQEVRDYFIQGAIHRNWARASREVLFQFTISRNMYDVLSNPERPPKPPPKKKKSELYAEILMLVERLNLNSS